MPADISDPSVTSFVSVANNPILETPGSGGELLLASVPMAVEGAVETIPTGVQEGSGAPGPVSLELVPEVGPDAELNDAIDDLAEGLSRTAMANRLIGVGQEAAHGLPPAGGLEIRPSAVRTFEVSNTTQLASIDLEDVISSGSEDPESSCSSDRTNLPSPTAGHPWPAQELPPQGPEVAPSTPLAAVDEELRTRFEKLAMLKTDKFLKALNLTVAASGDGGG